MSTIKKTEENPLLIAQTGQLKGLRINIDKPLVIGREKSCEVVIPDRQVSRFHARLTPGPDGIKLEDLGSKNGTNWNGNRIIMPVVLTDGDIVQIAFAQEFVFLTSDATIPLPSEVNSPARITMDSRSRRVWVDNQVIDPPLSVLQFHVMHLLFDNVGKVVSRQELISHAWGEGQSSGVSDQALDALIRRLRDRLATMDPTHEYIVTVRGHGIRLDNPFIDK